MIVRRFQFLAVDSEIRQLLTNREKILRSISLKFNALLYRVTSFIDGNFEEQLQEGTYTFIPASFWGVLYTDGNENQKQFQNAGELDLEMTHIRKVIVL